MESTYNVRGLKAAILAMSFLQMATNAIASILADIATAFPGVSTTTVQYLMTFPNLLVVVVSIFVATLSKRYAKRNIAVIGLLLGSFSGVLSFLFHGSVGLLYIWAGMLGVGIGLVVPIATSLISDYFAGNMKDAMLGYQTSAANVGSMLMTFLGGILAALGWQFNYLVYLLAIPGLVLTIWFVPKKNVSEKEIDRSDTVICENTGKMAKKIPGYAWPYIVIAAVFMMLFYMGPTNLALFVEERAIGTAMTAGTAATLLLLGGSVMGLLFGVIAGKIGKYTLPLGFAMLLVGYVLLYVTREIGCLYIGSFLVGTSNTLVLPQCMGQVVSVDKEQSTFLMSLVFAIANLGTFFAPMLTGIAQLVMKSDLAADRFLFAGIFAGVLASIVGIWVKLEKR